MPSGTLTRDLQPAEAQDLFIEIADEAVDSDAVSADLLVELQMSDGSTQSIATVAGAPMDTTSGDIWKHVGRIPSLPEGGTLRLRATLPPGAETARLQLGQVAFVSTDRNGFDPVAHATATIAPLAEKTFTIKVPADARTHGAALLFEINDSQYRVHRMLLHHVLRHVVDAT